MKRTVLNKIHKSIGAKMVEFAGFEMPIMYQGINYEHKKARDSLGVFDVSHMGEFFVEGPNAINLLQKICSNDISIITPGKAQYNYLPNTSGGVIDDLILYQLEKLKFLLVVNASNIEKDWAWINLINKDYNAILSNVSDKYSLLAVQGPLAIQAMQALTDFDLESIPSYGQKLINFANIDNVIVATTGYTGSGGIEIYIKNESVELLWHSILKAGEPFGIAPVGLAARDTLRLEMGYCLYGNELDENKSPIQAGLSWITKPTKKCVNSKWLQKEMNQKSSKRLIGFKLLEKGIPRKGYNILDDVRIKIGKVSSGTHSPVLEIGIGLGFIDVKQIKTNKIIYIEIRGKNVKAEITSIPFV